MKTINKLQKGILATLILLTGAAQARNIETKEIELVNVTHRINLDLNEKSVRCSSLGYGGRELKISVLDLELISFFDHSNSGEAEPCMTAGMMSCGQFSFPSDFDLFPVSNEESGVLTRFRSLGRVEADLHQVMKERVHIDHDKKTCQRTLVENVETMVDGVKFTHQRFGSLGAYPFEICLQL